VPQVSTAPNPPEVLSGGTPPFLCRLAVGETHAAWVHLAGEVDLQTSPQLESTLREAQLDASLVVLDAREVTFIDSSGVHAILDASEACEWGGARLMLLPSAAVERILELAGVRDRLTTFDLSANEPAFALRLV
jgi:anti-sigma B factor antagonist